jgi:hypothetical protein
MQDRLPGANAGLFLFWRQCYPTALIGLGGNNGVTAMEQPTAPPLSESFFLIITNRPDWKEASPSGHSERMEMVNVKDCGSAEAVLAKISKVVEKYVYENWPSNEVNGDETERR